jgi:A/G-specific adenine glycosylase
MDKFARLTLIWYSKHARKLPWRDHPDPYVIWVSEIMLQQTQVATVIPYFKRWMKKYPNISSLATAEEQDILAMWEGLGYYARARNLLKASRIIAGEMGGVIPSNLIDLKSLPGIGRYTAAAIVSMAYNADEATLDGNIKRVLARAFKITMPVNTTSGERLLWQTASHHLPKGRAGDYNQALMDIGAMVCLPKNPLCSECPFLGLCEAQKKGMQSVLPVTTKKRMVPTRIKVAAIVERNGKVLMRQRPTNGLLGGMWEFPAGEVDTNPALGLESAIESEYQLKVKLVSPFTIIHHAYTHFKLTEHAILCTLKGKQRLPERFLWVPLIQLREYPMGKVDRRIADKLIGKNG